MAKKKPEKKTDKVAKKPAAKKPVAKKPAAKKPAAKKSATKPVAKAATKTTAKPTKKPAKKPVTKKKPVKKATTTAAEALQPPPPPPPPAPAISLDPISPNPDFPHNVDKKITGSTSGTNSSNITWTIRRGGNVIATGNATPVTAGTFEITIPAGTLSDGVNDYELEVSKAGAAPAIATLDTSG